MIIHGAKPRSDPETIKKRLTELDDAFRFFIEVLHNFDGTAPGNPMGGREMAIAQTYADTAYLWAKEAVEQS